MLNSGSSACQLMTDYISEMESDILEKSDRHANNEVKKIPKAPHLQIQIFNRKLWALIDTKSQVTAISENFYEKLKKHNIISELPVSNITVATTIGKRSTTIRKQISLKFSIGSYKSLHAFLVIAYSTNDIILGNDWNLTNKIVIDNNYNRYEIRIQNTPISKSLVLFEQCSSDRLLSAKTNKETIIYVVRINKIDIIDDEKVYEKRIYELENKKNVEDNKKSNSNENEYKMMKNENNLKEDENVSMINEINFDENESESGLSDQLSSIANNLTGLDDHQKKNV